MLVYVQVTERRPIPHIKHSYNITFKVSAPQREMTELLCLFDSNFP